MHKYILKSVRFGDVLNQTTFETDLTYDGEKHKHVTDN